jgi:Leucine-rich repeat (LRR) protein
MDFDYDKAAITSASNSDDNTTKKRKAPDDNEDDEDDENEEVVTNGTNTGTDTDEENEDDAMYDTDGYPPSVIRVVNNTVTKTIATYCNDDPPVEATNTSNRKNIMFHIDCGFGEYKCFEIDEKDYQAVERIIKNVQGRSFGLDNDPELLLKCIRSRSKVLNNGRVYYLSFKSSHSDLNPYRDDIFQLVDTLEVLDLSYTGIRELPSWIGSLDNIKKLNLSGMEYLKELPNEICTMANLQVLDLSFCCKISRLPIDLGNIKNLKELNLHGSSINTLTDGLLDTIGNCKSLEVLDIGSPPSSYSNQVLLEIAKKCHVLGCLKKDLGFHPRRQPLKYQLSCNRARKKIIPSTYVPLGLWTDILFEAESAFSQCYCGWNRCEHDIIDQHDAIFRILKERGLKDIIFERRASSSTTISSSSAAASVTSSVLSHIHPRFIFGK